jgi:hypothetical protein
MEKIGEIEPELNDLVDTVLLVEDGAHPTAVIEARLPQLVFPTDSSA